MAQRVDAVEQIGAKFEAPLGHPARRRVVIWHDADGSFEGDFEGVAENGLGTSRPVSFAGADRARCSSSSAGSTGWIPYAA